MGIDENDGTTRREFVKNVALGATSLAASSSLDSMIAAPVQIPQAKEPNELGQWAEAMATFRDSLTRLVKAGSVVSDPAILDGYSRDCSFVAAGTPLLLVYPEGKEEVQEIVKLANKSKMPLVPVTYHQEISSVSLGK